MSTILALDTSSDFCSVALIQDGRLVEDRRQAPRQHTQLLLPMVDALLTQEALGLKDLDAIAFGAGPGSFTGLRICFSVVQGLAYGAGLPVIAVSTLAAMASAMAKKQALPLESMIYPALDARMSEVYWAAYQLGEDGVEALIDDRLSKPAEAAELIQRREENQTDTRFYCGPGWHYPELDLLADNPELDIEPWAGEVACLAAKLWLKQGGQNVREVQPVYLRNEISWEKRQRIRKP